MSVMESGVCTLKPFYHGNQTIRALKNCQKELTDECARQWMALFVLPENSSRVGTLSQNHFRRILKGDIDLEKIDKRSIANHIYTCRKYFFERRKDGTYESKVNIEFVPSESRPTPEPDTETDRGISIASLLKKRKTPEGEGSLPPHAPPKQIRKQSDERKEEESRQL
jgi:hypothetical protein